MDLLKQIQKFEPEAYVTYFPMEEFYMVHVWGRPLSGEHPTREVAMADALARLSRNT